MTTRQFTPRVVAQCCGVIDGLVAHCAFLVAEYLVSGGTVDKGEWREDDGARHRRALADARLFGGEWEKNGECLWCKTTHPGRLSSGLVHRASFTNGNRVTDEALTCKNHTFVVELSACSQRRDELAGAKKTVTPGRARAVRSARDAVDRRRGSSGDHHEL